MRTFNLTINTRSWNIPATYYERVTAGIRRVLAEGSGEIRFFDGVERWHTIYATNQHLIAITEPNPPKTTD